MDNSNANQQIALYEDPDHAAHLDVRVDGDTVWLTQQRMATLFGRDVTTIRKHLKSASKEELSDIPTSAFFSLVQNEGTRTVKRQVEHYNLDMIISVGYRVKSQQGVYFRRWANGVLKQHLLQGYSVNQKRLASSAAKHSALDPSRLENGLALCSATFAATAARRDAMSVNTSLRSAPITYVAARHTSFSALALSRGLRTLADMTADP